MKTSTMIPLVVAGGCGLVAMMGVKQYLANKDGANEIPMATALVAAAEIEFGSPLTELNTRFISVPKATCPEDVVVDLKQVENRTLKISRSAGDMIRVCQLSEEGQVGKTVRIPEGMRVCTIPVNATTNHSGILQPGNRIDLLLNYQVKRNGRDRIEKVAPVLQYIEVFAVEDQVFGTEGAAGGEGNKARNISLLVTNEQAMKLALAQKKGQITTMLRSNADDQEIELSELSEEGLFGSREGEINQTSSTMFDSLADAPPQMTFQMPDMGAAEPTPEPQPSDMFAQLQSMTTDNQMATGPVQALQQVPQTWTMTIYERGVGRRVDVNLDSEDPIEQPPVQSSPQAPPFDSQKNGPTPEELTGAPTEEQIEQATSTLGPLLELFQ